MGGFSRLQPKAMIKSNYRGSSPKSKSVTFAGQLYEQAMNNTFKSPKGRRPEYRPSSFPSCSVLVYAKLIKGLSRGYFEEDRQASSDYFTSVGTVAHEVIQFHMGYTGHVFGDWKCKNYGGCSKGAAGLDIYNKHGELIRPGKLTLKNCKNNICPECGSGMEYIEKEIKFRGLKGHIDGIIELPDGGYWIIDYKTCTKHKLKSGKLPVKGHLKQLPTYCYVLKKKYGLDIKGFSLLYLSRDNPFDYLEHAVEWSGKWDKNIARLVMDERVKFKSALRSIDKRNMKYAIEKKPCSSRAYYERELDYYTPCPYLGVCFNETKLKRELKLLERQFPYTDEDKNKLITAVNIK